MNNHCLAFETVVAINQKVLKSHEPHAVIDEGKILGALGRPLHTFAGTVLYPTVPARAGALIHGIAAAHGFAEGNKRTSWIAGMAYLDTHGFEVRNMTQEESGQPLLDLINGAMDLDSYTIWLVNNLV